MCAGAMHDNLLSAPSSSEVVVEIFGLLHFLFFFFFAMICPNGACMHFFFKYLIVSWYFVTGGEIYPGASIAELQQRVPGPSLSQCFLLTLGIL